MATQEYLNHLWAAAGNPTRGVTHAAIPYSKTEVLLRFLQGYRAATVHDFQSRLTDPSSIGSIVAMFLTGQLLGIADRNPSSVLYNPETGLFANIDFVIMHGPHPGADGELPVVLISSVTEQGFHAHYASALHEACRTMWDKREQIRNTVWRYASILPSTSRANTMVFVDRTLCFSADGQRQYTMQECLSEKMARFYLEMTRTGGPLISLTMFLAQKSLSYVAY